MSDSAAASAQTTADEQTTDTPDNKKQTTTRKNKSQIKALTSSLLFRIQKEESLAHSISVHPLVKWEIFHLLHYHLPNPTFRLFFPS